MQTINREKELFFYEKLKEIKNKKKSSPDFNNYQKSVSNYGVHLINQKNIAKFDGAEGEDDEEEDAESMPNTVSRGHEGDNYEAFNRAKAEALKKYKKKTTTAKKAKQVAQAAKQLKAVKNVKNLLNLAKVATGVTIEGLVVTWVIMSIQFVGGNIFKSKYIPPLGPIEKLIYIPVLLAVLACNISLFMPAIITTGVAGSMIAGVVNLASYLGVNLGL